jgi:hypothetical protein
MTNARRCQPSPATVRAFLVGGVLYAFLVLAFLAEIPDLSFAPDLIKVPLAAIVVSVIGPATAFSDGLAGWRWFAVTILFVLTFLKIACRLWQRFPEEEWFVLPLIAAAAIWVASGWFLAVVSAV